MARTKTRIPALLVLAFAAAALIALFLLRPEAGTEGGAGGNLSGSSVGGDFALVDEDGRAVTSATFDGQWRLMYFGYSFCPDVCPVDTANLAAGLRAFEEARPERAAKVQPLFVTVDPERDTPAALKEFTASFHPRLLGLTGTPEQVAATLRTFRVYAKRRDGASPESYLMDHMAAIYLFDPEGRPVAFIPGPEATPEAVRALLERHVR
jgi:protein SCO1/2